MAATSGGLRSARNQVPGGDVRLDVAALGRILGIWAHPDDETYLSGGLMAAAADTGQPTMCISATSGELGTTDPHRWPPRRLARRRRRELSKALSVLGVPRPIVLGYPDGGLVAIDPGRGVDELLSHIDRFKPDTVVTFGPDGFTGHDDHRVVGRWATIAARAASTPLVLHAAKTKDWTCRFASINRLYPIFYPGSPEPVDDDRIRLDLTLDGRALDRKTQALLAHATQTKPIIAALGCTAWRAWIDRESFVEPTPGNPPGTVAHDGSGGLTCA